MQKVEIAAKLRAARKAAGLTQSQAAQALSLSYQAISNYERGINRVDTATLARLCALYGVPLAGMLGERDAPAAVPENLLPMPQTVRVPLLGSIACGLPILAEENVDAYVDIPSGIRADYALLCQGDSMIGARILDGDIVYLRSQADVDNGEIAAVVIDDEATLKRVYKIGRDQLELRAENPLYPPLRYAGYELESVRIIGKAVGFTSGLR